MDWVLKAVRGAVTVDEDRPEKVVEAAKEVTLAALEANGLVPERVVSVIFTATPDLSSEFPAVGARQAGLVQTALMCAQEIPVPGSQPRCIRMLLHAYMEADRVVRHVYLRDAVNLRPDLAGVDEGVKTSGR